MTGMGYISHPDDGEVGTSNTHMTEKRDITLPDDGEVRDIGHPDD